MRKVKLKNFKEGLIIDIRDKEDYDKFHIENAINFPLKFLEQNYKNILNKKTRYYLICYIGKSSNTLSKKLRKEKYKIFYIKGGYKNII